MCAGLAQCNPYIDGAASDTGANQAVACTPNGSMDGWNEDECPCVWKADQLFPFEFKDGYFKVGQWHDSLQVPAIVRFQTADFTGAPPRFLLRRPPPSSPHPPPVARRRRRP